MTNDRYYDSPPLSPGSRPATERCSVAQLSLQMSQYSLRQREYVDYLTNETYPSDYISDSSVSPIQLDSPNSTYSLSPTSTQDSSTFPPSSFEPSSQLSSGYHSANIRQQRQQALRRQCSATHLLEISELVARMVNEGDQCSVSQATNIRSRQNSDPTSDSSPVIRCADYEGRENMEEYSSDPEIFEDPFEGFKIQEERECISWNCPWTGRGRAPDAKCCVKKNTNARKRGRRRAN